MKSLKHGVASLAWMFSLVATTAHAQSSAVMEATGFQQSREYSSLQPWEHIDTMTGGVVLSFTDLVLPGNAGRALKFQRTYNSKGSRGWTFGIAGLVMSVSDAWPQEYAITAPPTLITADGAEHRAALWLNPANQGNESYRLAGTDDFWKYDRQARKLFMPDGTISQFDASGRLISSLDPFGNEIQLTWTTSELRVVQTLRTDPVREVLFDLSQLPNTTPVSMPLTMKYAGRTWTYEGAPLTRVGPPIGPASQFVYEQDALTVTTANGGTVRYDFETKSFQQPDNSVLYTVVLHYRTADNGSGPKTWEYTYEFPGPYLATSTQIADPAPSTRRTVYEYAYVTTTDTNNLALAEYPGRTYTLKSRKVYGSGPDPLESDERTYKYEPVKSRNAADALPELDERTITRSVGAASRTYKTKYDYAPADYGDFHLPSTITEKVDDVQVRQTTRGYHHLTEVPYILGNPLSEIVAANGGSFTKGWLYDTTTGFRRTETIAGITTTFEADSFGNVKKATKANGKWTSFSYRYGQVSQITTPEYFVSREIYPDGTLKSETRAGRKTTYTYDLLGRLETTQPPGDTTLIRIEYDNVNGASVKTTRGQSVVTTNLDGFGRPIETFNGLASPVRTVTKYDAEGRKTYDSYPFTGTGDGVGTTIEYDHLDRVTSETNPDGTTRLRTYGLDTVTVTDENTNPTTYTRSAFGHPDDARLIGVVDADGKAWTYEYDVVGALTKVTGPGGVTRTWEYDSRHLLSRETHPESGEMTYTTYDLAGVLTQKTDARGTIFKYSYDGNDRVRSITAGTKVTQISYEPGSDNRTLTTIGGVSSAFRYNALTGHLESRTDTVDGRSFSTRFAYDANDNLTDITYPSGRHVRYEFDNENRITHVFRPATNDNYATGVEYHPSGAISRFTAGNIILTTIGFDTQRYWVNSIQAGALNLTYQYDNVGNVMAITDPRVGMNQIFTYDVLDRLKRAEGPYGVIEHTYDAHGNRQGANYAYDANNPFRLLSFGGLPMTYDGTGNLTGGSQATYTYTPDNLMDTTTVPGTIARFSYDADDWRLKKSVDGGSTTYYVRGPNGQLLTEWSISGSAATVRDHIYAGSRLLTVATSQTTP